MVLDKVANAKNLTRVRHMDDWSIDDLCAFFVELKMDQYCKFLYQNKYVFGLFFFVTGMLCTHLFVELMD